MTETKLPIKLLNIKDFKEELRRENLHMYVTKDISHELRNDLVHKKVPRTFDRKITEDLQGEDLRLARKYNDKLPELETAYYREVTNGFEDLMRKLDEETKLAARNEPNFNEIANQANLFGMLDLLENMCRTQRQMDFGKFVELEKLTFMPQASETTLDDHLLKWNKIREELAIQDPNRASTTASEYIEATHCIRLIMSLDREKNQYFDQQMHGNFKNGQLPAKYFKWRELVEEIKSRASQYKNIASANMALGATHRVYETRREKNPQVYSKRGNDRSDRLAKKARRASKPENREPDEKMCQICTAFNVPEHKRRHPLTKCWKLKQNDNERPTTTKNETKTEKKTNKRTERAYAANTTNEEEEADKVAEYYRTHRSEEETSVISDSE